MTERRLIRPSTLSPDTYADVVGLIPSSAHQLLNSKNTSTPLKSSSLPYSGRVDSSTSVAFLSLPGGKIHLWKNISCTLSEPLKAATQCEELVYPNETLNIQDNSDSPNNVLEGHLIALVSRKSSGNANVPPLVGLYACTPNGTLCVWNAVLLPSKTRSRVKTPDDVATIPLMQQDGEYVTLVSPLPPSKQAKSGNYGGVLIATNKDRIFLATKTTKQIHLQIKLLNLTLKTSPSSSSVMNVLGRMWYGDGTNLNAGHESNVIFAIHRLPKIQDHDVSMSRSLDKTGETSSTSSRKALKKEPPSLFITIKSNLVASLWSFSEALSFDKSKASLQGEEQVIALESLAEESKQHLWQQMKEINGSNTAGPDDLQLTLLATDISKQPFQHKCSLVLAVRASLNPTQHRLYLLQYTLDLVPPSSPSVNTPNPSFVTFKYAHWLSRYSTDLSATLSCSGLLISHPNTCHSSEFVIYSMWQSLATHTNMHDKLPNVTATAIHSAFSPQPPFSPRAYEMELPKDIAPALLGIGTTPHIDGVLLMSLSGCIINTRVKVSSSRSSMYSSEVETDTQNTINFMPSEEDDTTLRTLKNHLLSYFASLSSKSDASSDHFSAFVPPSLLHAHSRHLNKVVVDASLYIIRDDGSEKGSDDESLVHGDLLKERLKTHTLFCNVLNHSGIYKRLTEESKSILADHGEMISSSSALVPVVEKLILQLQDDQQKQLYMSFLFQLSSKSTNLVQCLQQLHNTLIPHPQKSMSQEEKTHLINLSYLLFTVFSETLRYREKYADILYDLRERGSRDCEDINFNAVPWTSFEQTRALLQNHLKIWISFMGNDDAGKSLKGKKEMELLALSLLEGFHKKESILDGKAKTYHNAKAIAIPFLQYFSNEDIALEKSVQHLYFRGIVEICDARERRAFRLKHSITASTEEEKSNCVDDYTLPRLLSKNKNNLLHQTIDTESGLTFSQFVLNWYNQKQNYGMVLELGQFCPNELKEVLKNGKIQNHQYVEDLRTEQWEVAKSSLLGLVDQDKKSFSNGKPQSLNDQTLFLSLAKLASKIDLHNKGDRSNRTDSDEIDNGLILVRCQEMLNSNVPDSLDVNHTVALSSQDLLEIAHDQIASKSLSYNKRIKAAMIGLAISETLSLSSKASDVDHSSSQSMNRSESAARIWIETIVCEMDTIWSSLVEQSNILTEEELKHLMSDSLFFAVERQYHRSKSSSLSSSFSADHKENLGFSHNKIVQRIVFEEFADSGDLNRLLKIAARLSLH